MLQQLQRDSRRCKRSHHGDEAQMSCRRKVGCLVHDTVSWSYIFSRAALRKGQCKNTFSWQPEPAGRAWLRSNLHKVDRQCSTDGEQFFRTVHSVSGGPQLCNCWYLNFQITLGGPSYASVKALLIQNHMKRSSNASRCLSWQAESGLLSAQHAACFKLNSASCSSNSAGRLTGYNCWDASFFLLYSTNEKSCWIPPNSLTTCIWSPLL